MLHLLHHVSFRLYELARVFRTILSFFLFSTFYICSIFFFFLNRTERSLQIRRNDTSAQWDARSGSLNFGEGFNGSPEEKRQRKTLQMGRSSHHIWQPRDSRQRQPPRVYRKSLFFRFQLRDRVQGTPVATIRHFAVLLITPANATRRFTLYDQSKIIKIFCIISLCFFFFSWNKKLNVLSYPRIKLSRKTKKIDISTDLFTYVRYICSSNSSDYNGLDNCIKSRPHQINSGFILSRQVIVRRYRDEVLRNEKNRFFSFAWSIKVRKKCRHKFLDRNKKIWFVRYLRTDAYSNYGQIAHYPSWIQVRNLLRSLGQKLRPSFVTSCLSIDDWCYSNIYATRHSFDYGLRKGV